MENIDGDFDGAFSIDDAGMDEFDVAEERVNLFGDIVNPDIMSYE